MNTPMTITPMQMIMVYVIVDMGWYLFKRIIVSANRRHQYAMSPGGRNRDA
jgi:hypothetical protein